MHTSTLALEDQATLIVAQPSFHSTPIEERATYILSQSPSRFEPTRYDRPFRAPTRSSSNPDDRAQSGSHVSKPSLWHMANRKHVVLSKGMVTFFIVNLLYVGMGFGVVWFGQ